MSDSSLVHLRNKLAKTGGAGTGLSSLRAQIQAEEAAARRSLLLVDCSGSMRDEIDPNGTNPAIPPGQRKVDAMRVVVDELQRTHPVHMVGFGTIGGIELITSVPNPHGGTPMHLAIEYGTEAGANHLVVVSDGWPDDPERTLDAARKFPGKIDGFYIGPAGDDGDDFMKKLVGAGGGGAGRSGVTDLGSPKQLAGRIIGLLGDGSAATKGPITL